MHLLSDQRPWSHLVPSTTTAIPRSSGHQNLDRRVVSVVVSPPQASTLPRVSACDRITTLTQSAGGGTTPLPAASFSTGSQKPRQPFRCRPCPAPPVSTRRSRDCLAANIPSSKAASTQATLPFSCISSTWLPHQAPGTTPAARELPGLAVSFIQRVTWLEGVPFSPCRTHRAPALPSFP